MIIVAPKENTLRCQTRGKRCHRFGHLSTPVMHALQKGMVRFGVAARLQGLPGEARRAFALGQSIMWHVIIEHHVSCTAALDERLKPLVVIKKMRFETQLKLHIRQQARLCAQRGGKALGKIRTAHPTLPREELRQHRGRDPARRQLGIRRMKPR